jgi:hypothetical protein
MFLATASARDWAARSPSLAHCLLRRYHVFLPARCEVAAASNQPQEVLAAVSVGVVIPLLDRRQALI